MASEVNGATSLEQAATRDSFSYKWARQDTYDSPAMRSEWQRWLLEKYFDSREELRKAFLEGGPKRILDAGCGAGVSSLLLFGDLLQGHEFVGIDISDSVDVARSNFAAAGLEGDFLKVDLMSAGDELGQFDRIFSEGVLHHTDSVSEAIDRLSRHLKPNGILAFYVYSKKSPVREFVDDFIRDAVAEMSDEEAWDALMPLTCLGKSLGELSAQITIEEDIEVLGIPRGTYDLQRLFYYHFLKAYFRPEYSLAEMNHINFDWYRPRNCHRHTPEEVEGMCVKAGLTVKRLHVEPSGITVLAVK